MENKRYAVELSVIEYAYSNGLVVSEKKVKTFLVDDDIETPECALEVFDVVISDGGLDRKNNL